MTSALERLRTSIAQKEVDKEMQEQHLKQLEIALESHKEDIEKNKNYTYTLDEQVIETELTEPGVFSTNCIVCNTTCHEHYPHGGDNDKLKCPATDNNGYCTICPERCHWSMHQNEACIHVFRTHTVTKTAHEVKAKYEGAMRRKNETENEISSLKREIGKVKNEIDAEKSKLGHAKLWQLHEKHLIRVSKKITREIDRTELGLVLGLSDSEIAVVKRNEDEFEMAYYAMLKKWFLRKSDRNEAWEELEIALKKCALDQIVADVLILEET